jgi:opacity protein-like surface antigen
MRRAAGVVVVVVLLAVLAARRASCDPLPLVPVSPSAYGSVFTTFQANTPLIRPSGDKQHRYPFYQYMDLSVASPEQHLSINTFLRARAIGNGDEASFDVYNAQIDYRRPDQKMEFRIGRQILSEGVNYTLMDGALGRVRPVEGVDLVAYAGRNEDDLQPKPDHPGDSYAIFGAKLRTSRLLGSLMTLGYEGVSPDAFTARHFLTASFDRVVPYTDFANVYSRLELDILQTNPAYFTAGLGISAAKPLYINLEYDTYKPDKDRDEFLQDRIFTVFSVSRLHEARIGATYRATSFLEVSASYSYATYDSNDGVSSHGNIGKLGFKWDLWRRLGLHAFNGMYVIEGGGRDRAIGMNAGVSEEILRGLEAHVEIAYANFHSITSKTGDAYSYIGGVQYMLVRNLMVRGEVELNTNPDFRHDVRGNFGLSYSFT